MFKFLCFIAFACISLISVEQSWALEDWEKWPKEKLEQEVTPSKWNPDKHPEAVIEEYITTSIEQTQNARKLIPCKLDVQYGPRAREFYDIYGTDLPQNATLYVWIHGGYWQEGSKDLAGVLAPALYSKGIRNIVLGYTLAAADKEHTLNPITVKDIEGEIIGGLKNITKRYPDASVIVGGHSAGAQLAAMLLHTTLNVPDVYDKIVGLHLVSGIYDLRPLIHTFVNKPLKLTNTRADLSSPLRIRTIRQDFLERAASFKISITVGRYDSNLFQQQAQEYYKLLKKSFPQTKFWKSETDDHYTLVENMAKADSEAGKQLQQFVTTNNETSESNQQMNKADDTTASPPLESNRPSNSQKMNEDKKDVNFAGQRAISSKSFIIMSVIAAYFFKIKY